MGSIDTSKLRAVLEAERDELAHQLEELTPEAGSADENFADSGQVAAELGESLTLAAHLREQLTDVEDALGRVDAGTYGRCERCGEAISDARLEAMPTARFCIAHA